MRLHGPPLTASHILQLPPGGGKGFPNRRFRTSLTETLVTARYRGRCRILRGCRQQRGLPRNGDLPTWNGNVQTSTEAVADVLVALHRLHDDATTVDRWVVA